MILVFGSLYDEMTELMCSRLQQLNFEYFLIDTESNSSNKFTMKVLNGAKPNVIIESGDRIIQAKDISGIYCRFVNVKRRKKLYGMSKKETSVIYNENIAGYIRFIDNFPGIVVNRLKHSLSNESKTYQQLQISRSGFLTPKTIITNDPRKVKQFYKSCNGKIIFKSISSIRSIVTKLSPNHLSRLDLVKNCPVQFQELIEGLEIRVHTVGKKVFATAVKSDAIDYRYAGKYNKTAEFFPYNLPRKIADECVSLSRSFKLETAGIDLKKTANGNFYCFEVNPSPAFIVYERMTGQPISREVALLLKG